MERERKERRGRKNGRRLASHFLPPDHHSILSLLHSLDVLTDALPSHRTAFPHTVYLAAGTQAGTASANTLTLLRLGGLGQGRHGDRAKRRRAKRAATARAGGEAPPSSSDDDDDSDALDSSDDSDAGEAPPTFHSRSIALTSGVNRVRAAVGPGNAPNLLAAWTEDGRVRVWDTAPLRASLDAAPSSKPTNPKPAPLRPVGASGAAHAAEGFGLAWSPLAHGRLASGDCAGGLRVWDPTEAASTAASWIISAPYVGHTASVEDIAWSPTEPTVLASCGVDRGIRIWDTRSPGSGGPQVTLCPAHGAADVNVLAWSARATFMLASGGDDGALKAWDLRAVAAAAAAAGAPPQKASPSSSTTPPGVVATIAAHRGPVTSVAWSPHEAAVLLTTGGDDACAVWDLALERDPDEEASLGVSAGPVAAPEGLPPQLLFLHAGQSQVKEGAWHPAIPGLVVTTAGDGFNVFKPANVGCLL